MKNKNDQDPKLHQERFGFIPDKNDEDDKEKSASWADYWSDLASEEESLEQLKKNAVNCEKCGLRATCTQVVFGEGNSQSDVVFVGEAPGAQEDKQGRPFVGRAGKLLDRILKACELDRQNVYITNVVKCRPPKNRTPKTQERQTCFPYLRKQVGFIEPEIIVSLGAAATKSLIHPDAKITKMRGNWQQWRGIKVMPTFHPAALLRDPRKKKPVWEDMQIVMRELESDE